MTWAPESGHLVQKSTCLKCCSGTLRGLNKSINITKRATESRLLLFSLYVLFLSTTANSENRIIQGKLRYVQRKHANFTPKPHSWPAQTMNFLTLLQKGAITTP